MKIITVNSGLGNQMFEYAFYIFLKNEIKIKDKIMFFINNCLQNGCELERVFPNIKNKNHVFSENYYKVKTYYYLNRIPLLFLKKTIRFKGTFSPAKHGGIEKFFEDKKIYVENIWFYHLFYNFKYASNNREIIFERFQFTDIKDQKNLEILNKIETTNSVSIHVRLGDFVNNPYFFNLSKSNYYDLAIKEIKSKVKDPHFFIFSDEVDKCRSFFKDLKNCYFIDWNKDKNSYRDMQLMSLCKHNIMANSSFSFWGAYLNKNEDKTVICLKSRVEYPDEWIKIAIPLAKDLL